MSPLLNLPTTTVHYSVTADAHPGALPRVLELFALRNITPDQLKVNKYCHGETPSSNISIDIHVTGLSFQEQEIILHKLANQVSVQNVREEVLFKKPRANLAS